MGARMFRKGLAVAVILLFIGVAFAIPINANVSKSSLDPVPDLDCDGQITIVDVKPNSIHTGISEVFNIGDPGSLLDWEIESYPDWGTWTFDPNSGTGIAAGKSIFIDIEIIAPSDPNTEFEGIVTFINSNDPSDFCIVDISLTTELRVQRIRDLVQSIDLRKIIVNPDGVVDTLEEISSILGENEDCGCDEDSSPLEWGFPIICIFVGFLLILGIAAFFMGGPLWIGELAGELDRIFNCPF